MSCAVLWLSCLSSQVETLRKRYAGAQVTGATSSASSGAASAASASSAGSQKGPQKELIYSNAVEFPLDLVVGRVLSVAHVADSDKLYVVQVDVGAAAPKQIVSALRVKRRRSLFVVLLFFVRLCDM